MNFNIAKFSIILISFCLVSYLVYNLNFNNLNPSKFVNINFEKLDTNLNIDNVQKVIVFYNSLLNSEKKVYSQNGEDGVLEKLVEIIKINKMNGYYVEFGTEDGSQCNTRYFREKFNWTGLLMDGSNENLKINLHKETILFSNILSLFSKYNVKNEIDILSEDTDYNDYYIVEEILKKYRPKILVHEINQQPGDLCVTVPKENRLIFWDGSNYHGASVCAFWCLAKNNDYTMVYCDKNGVNCFWLRNDLIENYLKLNNQFIKSILTPKFLYKKPYFTYRETGRAWTHVKC